MTKKQTTDKKKEFLNTIILYSILCTNTKSYTYLYLYNLYDSELTVFSFHSYGAFLAAVGEVIVS